MYINQPYLKGSSRKAKTTAKSINEYQFSKPQNPSLSNTKQLSQQPKNKREKPIDTPSSKGVSTGVHKSKLTELEPGDEMQFENTLMDDLQKLLKKWDADMAVIQNDLRYYDHSKESESEIKAFQHCVNLLDAEFKQAQSMQDGANNLVSKKMLQIDDYKLRILKQIKDLKEENESLMKHREKYAEEEKQREKKHLAKKNMQEKLREEKQKIQKLRNSLVTCKEKSYQQKNEFVEIQTEEFRLQNQIRALEEEQHKYEEENIRINKMNDLLKIKEKARQFLINIEDEVRPHLERKIEKMARLRSELKNIDEALEACLVKIQDQNIVVDALKEKLYHEEAYYSEDSNLFEQYRRKYNDIYFGDQGENNAWNDYNKYLKQLINKTNHFNERVYTEIPRARSKKHSVDDRARLRVSGYKRDDSNNQILDLRPDAEGKRRSNRDTQNKFNGNNSTKISYNPQKYKSERVANKEEGRTKLPRLVKIEGKTNEEANIKNKVKQGLVKNTSRDDDFSLESIHSGDSKVSGQIIQVEFHKK